MSPAGVVPHPVRRERGSAVLVLAVVLAGVAALAVAGRWSAVVVGRSRAQTVADLSALAAASHGPASAGTVSLANGWRVGDEREVAGVFVVSVTDGATEATAAARACTPLSEMPGAGVLGDEGRSASRCR